MKAIQFIRPAISTTIAVAVILSLMFTVCGPFLNMGISGLMGVYADMADAVVSGNGGEFSDSLLSQMDNGSQTVIGDLWGWAQSTVDQLGAGELLDGITAYVEGWIK